MEKTRVEISLHGSGMPEKHGDWTDLATGEDVKLEAMESMKISLSVAMKLPKGWYAELLPRSSTFEKWGIIMTNGMGIIDNGFCGNKDIWKFPALAVRATYIPKGTRIAQFRLVRKGPEVKFIPVGSLEGPDRGGFGSTGT